MILLDDVELSLDYNLLKLIVSLENNNLDIISPIMSSGSTNSFHKNFMTLFGSQDLLIKNEVSIVKTNYIELFNYIMKCSSFYKYLDLLNEHIKWMWGIDYILFDQSFQLGIYVESNFIHHFSSSNPSSDAFDELGKFFLIYIYKNI